MNLDHVFATADGAAEPAVQTWEIARPAGEAPLRLFRQELRLRFPVDLSADGLRIDADATVLKGEFKVLAYNARGRDDSLKANFSQLDAKTVVVELDAPREITSLRRNVPTIGGLHANVFELYRMDGDAVSEEPTVGFPEQVHAAPTVQIGVPGGRELRIDAGNGLAIDATEVGNLVIGSGLSGSTGKRFVDRRFVDRRFAVRLQGGSGPIGLTADSLSTVNVRSYPTGPRLGVRGIEEKPPGTEISRPAFFWQVPGEVGTQLSGEKGNFDAGKDFADELQRQLDQRSFPPQAGFFELALVVESDSPCQFKVTHFNVAYHHLLTSFAGPEDKRLTDKQVLRFSGRQLVEQGVSIRLPRNAAVQSATLETSASFSSNRLLGADQIGEASETLKQGVHFDDQHAVAQKIAAEQAISTSGVALLLTPLTAGAKANVSIGEDAGGQPLGRRLAEATIDLTRPGQPAWTTVLFPQPVIIPSAAHWLIVRAVSGSGVWLARESPSSIKILRRVGVEDRWEALRNSSELQASYQLLSQVAADTTDVKFVAVTGGQTVASSLVHDDANENNATNGERARRKFELTAALNSQLQSPPATDAPVLISVMFRSSLQGILTVYAPVILYEHSIGTR